MQVPLVHKSLMNAFKAYNLAIIYPILQTAFQCSLKVEHLELSSDVDYASMPSEHDALVCVFIKGHTYRLDTALYPTEKINGVFMLYL